MQRDYSGGLAVKFQARLPTELEGKIPPALFEETLNRINALYAQGEKVSSFPFHLLVRLFSVLLLSFGVR